MHFAGSFPATRMRRNRRDAWSRTLSAESRLAPQDLIWPIFLTSGTGQRVPVASMPGVFRVSVDRVAEHVAEAVSLGIPAVALFPYTPMEERDKDGTGALDPENLMCRAARALKKAHPELGLIGDVALDTHTSHGHDGVVRDGHVHNEESVEILSRMAVLQAEAGMDCVAPSDMMDGRIGAIRAALDARGLEHTRIMSYAAKYASGFFAPFRDAVGSLVGPDRAGPSDKKTYQMDPANGDEALREVALDVAEGADMVMVKPGLPYLDVLYRVRKEFGLPTFVYQVSGEYSMIMAAVERGWLDHDRAMMEGLMAFKRAGANGILTYFAVSAARRLKEG
ncbi:porphobilinogen synthase [Sabulicella glaciei]|uniref:Delta-aminolevulinic acid dehydratase n=1 Tax=Sabulicella glaciei TaxID=2984948 RepID=A0ABT3NV89_9PROT|nr:porphobilinogen synthase [Roseococcus sp. MDT2-1-1]MCW8086081.1 porphobilinogen synthase [Roseococcus sp. MDT2-1-1]